MIQNLEIRKQGDGYLILEQAGSNYHADEAVYEAGTRADAEAWLTQRGAAQDDVARALDDVATADRVFVEISDSYAKEQGFPKQ